MVGYPRTLAEFKAKFSTGEACRAYLAMLNGPEGVVCPQPEPACGNGANVAPAVGQDVPAGEQRTTTRYRGHLRQPDTPLLILTDVVDKFNGLINVEQDTLTGTVQCVSVGDSATLIGTNSQVTFNKPEINLREELAKQKEAPRNPYSQVWFDGVTAKTDFDIPSGYDVWAVYNEGLLVKEGAADQYTTEDNGNNKTVSFNVAPANGNDICAMIYKEAK